MTNLSFRNNYSDGENKTKHKCINCNSDNNKLY